MKPGPIGVFDSGYGGLTILKEFQRKLPDNDYIYLGDNARTPYGTRSFEVVYQYTLQAVKELFSRGCHLVIVACNTASAKALRSIQQRDLPGIDPNRRVLGVIRPSVELVNEISTSRSVGVLGTPGTVNSESYIMELDKISEQSIQTFQEACPMWVPLVENNEIETPGANYFVKRHVESLLLKSENIDTIILGCTHYPLLMKSIRAFVPQNITIVDQGPVVADKLIDYLQRHPEMNAKLSTTGETQYLTTENHQIFNQKAEIFLGKQVQSTTIHY